MQNSFIIYYYLLLRLILSTYLKFTIILPSKTLKLYKTTRKLSFSHRPTIPPPIPTTHKTFLKRSVIFPNRVFNYYYSIKIYSFPFNHMTSFSKTLVKTAFAAIAFFFFFPLSEHNFCMLCIIVLYCKYCNVYPIINFY